MYSKEFNTMVMFNGEIYNHAELRKDLQNKGLNFTHHIQIQKHSWLACLIMELNL